jgi:hypothetical protein
MPLRRGEHRERKRMREEIGDLCGSRTWRSGAGNLEVGRLVRSVRGTVLRTVLPSFLVSRGNKGVAGKWLVSRGKKGVREFCVVGEGAGGSEMAQE